MTVTRRCGRPHVPLDRVVRTLIGDGFDVKVIVAQVIPYLADFTVQLDELFGVIADAGACSADTFPKPVKVGGGMSPGRAGFGGPNDTIAYEDTVGR